MPLTVPAGTTKDTVDVTAGAQSIKSGVNVKGSVNTVNATFTGSTLSIGNSDGYAYSAIMAEAHGIINNINANISGANITVNGGKTVSGTLIKSMNQIGAINAELSNNTLTGDGSVTGGMVSVDSIGSLASISGTYSNNIINVSSAADITGGILFNQGVLGSISDTEFLENASQSASGNVNGGVLGNIASMTGDITNTKFVDNSITSTNGNANGAGIYNIGMIDGKIINSTFTGNTVNASKGTGHGAAIYTTTDLYILGDGGTTLFQNNKVVDSSGTRNEGIYVDSKIAKLTLATANSGKIYIYDDIDGAEGYNLTLNGDAAGKIGLYGNITNANVTVSGGNVDFVNSETTDFNFGQFSSSSGAKYSLDLNLSSGKADNFTVSAGSSGTIIIDSLNVLGALPDESKLIKILNSDAANKLGISITQSAIDKFSTTETRTVNWSDDVPSEISFGDLLYNYERNDTLYKTISTAASVYGGLIDSLQYTVTTTEGTTVSTVMGDTLRVMNQANSASVRSFSANASRNTHTVTEDLGSTGTGTFNIVGVKDTQYGEITTELDANGHSLFVLDKASTLNLSDLQISNAKDVAGSVFNITNSDAVVTLDNVIIDESNGSNAIINQGTLNFTGRKNHLYTAISGSNGTLNINDGSVSVWNATGSIDQKLINVNKGSLIFDTAVAVNSDINVASAGGLTIWGDSIHGDITNAGTLNLHGGTVNNAISGGGKAIINSTVTMNERLGNAVTMTESSVLNISADNIGGAITNYSGGTNRSVINLSDGTLNYAINGASGRININGDIIANAYLASQKIINSDSTLTINANNMGAYETVYTDTNNGTIYLTGGTLHRIINGSGSIRIIGDVAFRPTNGNSDISINQSVIIDEGGVLTTAATRFQGGTVTNNNILNLTDGALGKAISGTGITNITGPVVSNASISTSINIAEGGTLTSNATNIAGAVNNSGDLFIGGGTLTQAIQGTGVTTFNGSTTVNAAINQLMKGVGGTSVTVRFNSVDYIGADYQGGDNAMSLGSGTLSHKITNVRTNTDSNSNIIFAEGGYISGNNYNLGANSTTRLKASQLGASYVSLGGGSHLYVGDGTLARLISGNGTLHITGNVNYTNNSIASPIIIETAGIFTSPAQYLKNSITNSGIYNISGTLERNILGSGTVNINNNVAFEDGAGVAGTLNFNNGTLTTEDKTITNYSVNNVTGTGTWSLDFDAASGLSDTFTLGTNSNAVITPNITLLNVDTTFQNKVFQVLKGATGVNFNLASGAQDVSLVNRDEDFITSADVYSDETYEIRDKIGTGSAVISKATTTLANDSISVSLNSINWGETKVTKKDLFHDWLMYSPSTEVKSFNFRAANEVFNVIDENYIANIAKTVNINGVSSADSMSRINLARKRILFNIPSGGKLNLSNVELYNGWQGSTGGTFIQVAGGAYVNLDNIKFTSMSYDAKINNSGTIDNLTGIYSNFGGGGFLNNYNVVNRISGTFKDTNFWGKVVSNNGSIGSIEDSLFTNIVYGTSSAVSGLVIVNGSGKTIENISSSEFTNNRLTPTSVSYAYAPAIYNTGTITTFEDNSFNNNYVKANSVSALTYGRGGAVYNAGNLANGIINSSFTGNYIDASGGQGGALYNTGTIKVIDGSNFSGNYIKYNPNVSQNAYGGAIYYTGTITDGIKNSTFDGNYIELEQIVNIDNAGYNIGGGALYNASGKVLNIVNTDFLNNRVYNNSGKGQAVGGALVGAFNITGGKFENNSAQGTNNGYSRGGAVWLTGTNLIDGVTFINNNSLNYGGAIGGSFSGKIINSRFEGNNSSVGGGFEIEGGTLSELSGTFINNSGGTGGAIANIWMAQLNKLSGTFTGNHANNGGAVANAVSRSDRTTGLSTITDSTFEGNYATSRGGAIYNDGSYINEITDSSFNGNYVNSTGAGYGGAIMGSSTGRFTDGIYNSIFKDNYVLGKTNAFGGAIYAEQSLTVGARDNGLTEFTGNYVQINGGEKDYQAIYFNSASSSRYLTLNTRTNGILRFNDSINGASGYQTRITGDGTGKLELFNNIHNSNITANNTYIDTRNNKIFNYNFLSLDTSDSVKYAIDVDMSEGIADNFTLGYGSTGVMTIDDINFIGSSNENKIFQIIKNNRSDVELVLSKDSYGSYNVVDNFLESSVPDVVYNDGDYRQESGIILSTTDTYHDTIQYIASETHYNPLSIIVGKDTENARSLVFRNSNGITLDSDLSDITGGTLSILGTSANNTINANGHKLFNLKNETNFSLSNLTLTGSDDLITVSNGYASVNLNNVSLTGDIRGTSNFKLNLDGDNRINGVVSNATTTLNSGNLVFNRDTFADSGKLVVNGGNIDLRNDVVDNYVINDLSSNANARYNLDINLRDFTSDTLTINSSTASGVVTIDNVNYLGNLTLDDVGSHSIKVLNTSSGAISLALSDSVRDKSFVLGDIRRDEQDSVAMVTNFDTVYYNYYRLGNIVGKLSVESDSKDSITINAIEEWNADRVATSILGDTLQLVANSDLAVRILQANKSTDTYNVNSDIGNVAKGELVISGVNDGVEASSINLANHRGFVLGKDTSLSVNSARIIGSSTPIEVTDSSVRVELNDAYLSGGIKASTTYELSLIGNGTTTVNGTLTNAQATLTQGGFRFNKDTFAGSNTSLKVDGGTILLDDGEINEYVFNNLVSSSSAGYAIDIDLSKALADTINVKSGSGVIAIDSFRVTGELTEVNHDYEIKILKNNGNAVSLSVTDALLSQLGDDFKLGSYISTEYESLNAVTKWNTVYHKEETTNDIFGRFKVNDSKDGIVVTPSRIEALGTQTLVWDDTLKLWNQLESTNAKEFNFDSATDVYVVKDNSGTSAAGTMTVNGKVSGNSLSTINADGNTLFDLSNATILNLNNVNIINGRGSAGSVLNLTNSEAEANLNNVTIGSTGSANGINNAGVLNFVGGKSVINTGISGTSGILNINGGFLTVGANSNITQSEVNVTNGRLALDVSDIVYGKITIGSGSSGVMSGSAITQALSNSGDLTLLSGTLAFDVVGDGLTIISGAVNSRAQINQAISINNAGSLTISADNIGDVVLNSNSLILTGGTLSQQVSGSGKITVQGNVDLDAKISQAVEITSEGSLTTNANNIGGLVVNSRDLNLTGGVLSQGVSGSGRTNIEGNVTLDSIIKDNVVHLNSGVLKLTQNSDLSKASQFNVHSGMLDLSDGSATGINLGDVVLNGDLTVAIDVALGSNLIDALSASSLTNTDNHSIIISSIKVLTDTSNSLPIEMVIANDVLRESIKLTNEVISVQGADSKNNYLVSYSKVTGKLKFEYGSLSTAITMTSEDRQYNLHADEISSLGEENGADSTLTVNGNNHNITVSSGGQWLIGANRTVNLNDVVLSGADVTAIVNSGNLNMQNVTLRDNLKDITNTSSVSFAGTNVLDNIDGTGSMTVTGGETTVNNSLIQDDVTVSQSAVLVNKVNANIGALSNAGTLSNLGSLNISGGTNTGTISGSGNTTINEDFTNSGSLIQSLVVNASKTLTNSGTVSGSVTNRGTIANNKDLTVTGGLNVGTINGSGTTTVNGDFTNSGNLTQAVAVNSGKTLTNSGAVTGSVTNRGTVANNKDLTVTGGLNAGTINGSGTTTVNGDFTNSGSLTQAIVVNSGKTLTNSGIVTGSVTNRGTVANNNALTLTGGTNSGTINGSGTTTVDGDFANSGNLTQAVVINSDKTLTNSGTVTGSVTNRGTIANNKDLTVTGGLNAGTINGSGTTTVNGDFTNSGNLTQAVVVNSGKTLTNSGTVSGSVTNRGTIANNKDLTVTAGTNSGTINGSGTTTVNGDFTNSGSLTQSVVVNSDKTLTNSGAVTGSVTNRGTIANNKDLTVTAGTNFGTINGSGTTTVNGDFTNSGNLTQAVVVNSGKTLTNSGIVTGGVTNRGTITNNNALTVTGGTNAGTINGSGTTTVNGDFTNSGSLTQSLVVNASKTLTNSGSVSGNITNSGTIANSKDLLINGGSNSGIINGTGSSTISDNFTNSGDFIQNSIIVNEGKKLTNSSLGEAIVKTTLSNKGEISNDGVLTVEGANNLGLISGLGTLNVSGQHIADKQISQNLVNIASTFGLTNNAGIQANVSNSGTLDNNALLTGNLTNTGTVSSNAGNLHGNVSNSGSVTLEGGTFGNYQISGSGSTVISGNVVNGGSISQGNITLNSNTTLTNNAGKTITSATSFKNSGNVVNAGVLNASGLQNFANSSIANTGTLNVNGGNNSGTISGNGTSVFGGNFTNSGSIAQTTVTNNSVFTNDGTLTADITNSGTINNSSTITGDISNNVGGVITSLADNLVGDITNKGTLNLNGSKTQGTIEGSGGTLNVNGDLAVYHDISGNTLSLNNETTTTLIEGSLDLEGLTANGGSLITQNSKVDEINLGNVTLNTDLNISIDADLASETGDRISGSTLTTNGHYIIIDSINVLTDSIGDVVEINVADSILRSSVKLTSESIAVAGVKENINYLVTYSASTGNLSFTYGDLNSALHALGSQRNYTLGSDENVTKDLGVMEDGLDVLTINGNNHKILGNAHEGIIIKDDNTLNINNVSSMRDFEVALDNRSDGKLNITNTTLSNNGKDILNAGQLTFGGTNSVDTLEGSGTTVVNNGQTTINTTFTQDKVEVNSNAILVNNGVSDVEKLLNSGKVLNTGTSNIASLTNNSNSTYENRTNLTLGGGTNAGAISGVGTTTIVGDFTNSGSLSQNLVVNSGKTLTNSGSVSVTGGSNSGTISGIGTTTVAGDFTNSGSLSQNLVVNSGKTLINSGSVSLLGGTNSGTISGVGTTTVAGDFTNNGSLSQNLVVNSGKTLTNSGSVSLLGGTNSGTISGTGTTTVVGDFTNNGSLSQNLVVNSGKTLTNSGSVSLLGGTNAGTISGTGTTTVAGDFTNSGSLSQNLVVNSGKTLTNSGSVSLLGGTNSGTISGVGTTTVAGDFTNNGSLSQNLVVNSGKTFTNSGSVSLLGGTNAGTISGVGTTTVAGDFTNSGNLTQTIVVNSGKTLTNSNTVNGSVTNRGNISNSKNLALTGGENLGTISGVGTTTVSGVFTNSGAITQNSLTNSGVFTNSGTLSANLINAGTLTNTSTIIGLITNNQGGVLTSNANNLRGEVSNSGTLNILGGTTQNNITGSNGLINVDGNFVVSHNISGNTLSLNSGSTTNIETGSSLSLNGIIGNGGALNVVNNALDTINLGNVVLNNDLSLSIDTDLGSKWADKLTSTSVEVNGGSSIVISSINILADSKDRMPLSFTVADEQLKDNVKLDGAFRVENSDLLQDSYLISYEKETGELKFEYSSLAVAINSQTLQKAYVMNQDEVITVGSFDGFNGKALSINGNGNNIIGSVGVNGPVVNEDQELSFNNVTYTGFDTGVTNNAGILNITDTKFENNTTDIVNNSVLNLYGQSSFTTVSGTGTTNVSSYKTSDGQVVNALVTLNKGGTFEQSALNIDSNNKFVNNGTIDVEKLTNSGILTNNEQLTLISGSNKGSILGSGEMEINGKFTSDGLIEQSALKVNEGAEFTVALDKVNTSNNIVTNEGTLFVSNGSNSLAIEGSGRTEVVGEVVNTGVITQQSVTVAQGGKLTTSLDNLHTDEIINSGTLKISDDKINKNISGTETGVVSIDHSMRVDSTISGTGIALNSGTVVFGDNANLVNTSNFIVNGGAISLVNNNASDLINLGQHLTMNKDLDLMVDVDLANKSMDRISAESLNGDGFINVKQMNMLSDAQENETRVEFANEALKENVKTDIKTVSYSPIWKYGVSYDKTTGEFVFNKGGFGSGTGTGGNYNAYNPAIMSSPVATQIGGQLTVSHTISEAFEHSDWYFRLPKADRFARSHANEYAIAASTDYNGNLGRYSTNYSNEGIWARPFATFENVALSGGPKVNVMSYGTIAGGDSDFRKLSNGWSYVSSAYVSYNGSQFSYDGVSSTFNGGMLGMTGTLYKGNFYTALTATAGAGFTETHNAYGKEDVTMLMGGVASKSGYNIELNDGKFIIQPNLLMSYSFVSTLNYTNAAGIRMDNDPMHTIQIAPSIRFIGNTKGGWQPYGTVGMVWNVMNNTNVTANGITLPQMSTKPYVEYGVGLQKLWNDNFSAYGQAVMRNGGRTGVALSFGFKWNVGRDHSDTKQKVMAQPDKKIIQKSLPAVQKTAPVPDSRKILKQLSVSNCAHLGLKLNRTSRTSDSGVMKAL